MSTQWYNLDDLEYSPDNPNEGDIGAIYNLIKQHGFRDVVQVREGVIKAGEHRLEALKWLRKENYIPTERDQCVRVVEGRWQVEGLSLDDMTEAQARAFMVGHNRSTRLGHDDATILAGILQDLYNEGVPWEATGYQPDDLDELLKDLAEEAAEAEKEDEEGEQHTADEWQEKWQVKLGDLYQIKSKDFPHVHRLLCGDITLEADRLRLMDGKTPVIITTDPPYGVKYDASWRAEKLGSSVQVGEVLNDDLVDWAPYIAAFGANVLYVWHAAVHGHEVAAGLIAKGYDIRSQIIWNKNTYALSRGHYHWKHEPCQPAGTMIRTPKGEVPIELLKNDDLVLSYNSYSSAITGKRDGRKIKVARRDYNGDLYEVGVAGNKKTKTTDGHRFTVRFSKNHDSKFALYLMKKGNWWRVGITRIYNSRGFGLRVRLDQEGGEEAWLLGVYDTKSQAEVIEQITSVKYGIPTTCWSTDRNVGNEYQFRSEDQIQYIYDNLDIDLMEQQAQKLLEIYGRRQEYPLVTNREPIGFYSRRVTTLIRACNLVPEIMELPIPKPTGDEFDWSPIVSVYRESYAGIVYSLDVEIDHHYIADGIVTHNCWYAVKKGENANWQGARDQITVWDVQSRSAIHRNAEHEDAFQSGHGTQKPVEVMRRAILNHTTLGDLVVDPFMGSGTTLVAAEKTGRLCYGLELNPSYVAAILGRLTELGCEVEHVE